ncbi:MAG: mercuric transport protein MerTP [Chitinophagaceae bacterium]
MISVKTAGASTTAGLLSAFAASLCCITPVVALIAGGSSIGSGLSWLEPARPYLIGLSVVVLAFAWYQKLRPVAANPADCLCEPKKASFLQSKAFLSLVTLFAVAMMTFPLYAGAFYGEEKPAVQALTAVDNKKQVSFTIQGMTCAGCEAHVNSELAKETGVLGYITSYASKSSTVTFDAGKTTANAVEAAINRTGYKVVSQTALTPIKK